MLRKTKLRRNLLISFVYECSAALVHSRKGLTMLSVSVFEVGVIVLSLFYFKYDTPHTGCNLATLVTIHNYTITELYRLTSCRSQVLTHRDKFGGSEQ